MILDNEVYLKGNSKNIKYYTNLGYNVIINELFLVKIEDLTSGSTALISCKCDICGNVKKIQWGVLFKYLNNDIKSKYYCKICCRIKRLETNNNKYGGNSPTSSKEIIDKIKKTNLERYGTTCSLHNKNIKEKTKKTCNDKYGFDNPSKSEIIKNKITESTLNKFGVKYPLQNDEIYNKLINTNLDRIGVKNQFQSDYIKQLIYQKMFDKWGMYYTQTDDFKKKSKKTNINKYGCENFTNSIKWIELILNNKKIKYDNIIFLNYDKDKSKYLIHCKNCGSDFLINNDLLYTRTKNESNICIKCNPIGDKYISNGENKISEFIEGNGFTVEKTNVKLIKPHHLDILIKEKNIAIEFNGIYWHSDKFKDKNYHLNKYNKCCENNIFLYQIWEDDWNNRKDIVKSMILNKLGININKIYARKCIIKLVDYKDKDNFLNENHIQGKTTSSVNIGLYYNNELVSLMTFGRRKTNNKSEFELIRFCNKLNTTVVGGASKIFNYFIKNYEFNEIISYSDNSYSNGDIYKTLNFKYAGTSINYYWSDGKNRFNRFNFNKKRLVKQGFDKNKTELEIMRDRGFNRIWGAGNKKWIFS